jgi:hypothetical protein
VTEKPPERPIHVRVAEALGWTRLHYRDKCHGDILIADQEKLRWFGRAPGEMIISDDVNHVLVPRYDTSWGDAGPFIEKYGIELGLLWPGDRGQDYFQWMARTGRQPSEIESTQEDKPLLAICALILALKEAGKL